MKWYSLVSAAFLACAVMILFVILPAYTIRGLLDNDCRKIRTFSGVHTLVYKGTLWRLEPVELDKAGVVDRLSCDSTEYKR